MTHPSSTMTASLSAFRTEAPGLGWDKLPFLGTPADAVAAAVDARIAVGAHVLPPVGEAFAALRLAPLADVRVVVIGQDPYPSPGDAHGLAFSYRGPRRLPPSLKVILAEALGRVPPAGSGDLTDWARQGVLLLNTALTVEAGAAGAHLRLGWDALARDVVPAVSAGPSPCVFMLWGGKAREMGGIVDGDRHLVLECGHPSPLNRHRDFAGCGHFRSANAWLAERGRGEIDWDVLPGRTEAAAESHPRQASLAL